MLCDFAGIARSSYYKWLNKVETKKDKENSIIIKELTKIYDDVNGIYGYRRMTMNINRNLNNILYEGDFIDSYSSDDIYSHFSNCESK